MPSDIPTVGVQYRCPLIPFYPSTTYHSPIRWFMPPPSGLDPRKWFPSGSNPQRVNKMTKKFDDKVMETASGKGRTIGTLTLKDEGSAQVRILLSKEQLQDWIAEIDHFQLEGEIQIQIPFFKSNFQSEDSLLKMWHPEPNMKDSNGFLKGRITTPYDRAEEKAKSSAKSPKSPKSKVKWTEKKVA